MASLSVFALVRIGRTFLQRNGSLKRKQYKLPIVIRYEVLNNGFHRNGNWKVVRIVRKMNSIHPKINTHFLFIQ